MRTVVAHVGAVVTVRWVRTAGVVLAGIVAFSAGQVGSAAPPTGLTIDPIGYRIVDGAPLLSEPMSGDGLIADTGLTATAPSNGSTPSSRSVIGTDDRTRVADTQASPYRRTGQVSVTIGSYKTTCTGWLISPRAVVTAGHCLTNGYSVASDISYTPARNGTGNDPYESVGAEQIWLDSNYQYGVRAGRDWALIALTHPIGDTLGWYGMRPVDDVDLTGRPARIIGYPTDRPAGTMWQHTSNITEQSDRNFYYTTDTAGGQSGSAVTTDDDNIADGIHVTGVGAGPHNGATALTAELFNTFAALR
jgi:glutamyl endopeptidase